MADIPIIQLKQKDLPGIREKILEEQNGICPICKREIKDPCVDHHHKKRIKGTGLIRGVLCRSCNVFIAKSENNCIRYAIPYSDLPMILRNMADYLERPQLPYIHPSEAGKEPKLQKASYNSLAKVLKKQNKRVPPYPRSGKLTKELVKLFKKHNISPKFYR